MIAVLVDHVIVRIISFDSEFNHFFHKKKVEKITTWGIFMASYVVVVATYSGFFSKNFGEKLFVCITDF